MPRSSGPLTAMVEDYDSAGSEVIPNTRKTANVKAKRSNPSDLGKERSADAVGPDGASDSGYSSHTAATMSSTNSSQSPKKGAAPAVAQPDAPTATPTKSRRRPTQSDRTESSQQLKHERRQLLKRQELLQQQEEQEQQQQQRQQQKQKKQEQQQKQEQQRQQKSKQSPESTSTNTTPRKPLVRTESSRSRRPRRDSSVCNDANCKQCGRDSRSQPSPLDSGVDVSGPSQRSPQGPSSPTASRQMPGAYPQERALIQPASSVTRTRSNSRPRPNSWYGPFGGGVMMPSNQHGPPPSMSAYTNLGMMRPPVQTAVQQFPGFYPPAYYMQPSPVSYENPVRPALPQRATDTAYSTRARPRSGNFGPPLISYEPSARPSARYAPPGQQRAAVSKFEDSSSEEESSSEEDEEVYEERPRAKQSSRDMPPPSTTTIVRRPSNRTENPFATRQPPEYRDRSRTITTTSSSRNSSNRRPSIASSGTKATSYSGNSTASAQVIVEPSYRSRRISYMGHEQRAELEAKRNSLYSTTYPAEVKYAQAYYDERPMPVSRTSMDRERRASVYDIAPMAPTATPMSNVATAATTITERKRVSRQQAQAEDYMGSRGTGDRDPLSEYLRGASVPNTERREDARTKRASRVPSDSKSTTSRSSAGARTTVTRDTATGAIKIVGIEQGQNINLQLAGNVDGGHTVQIRQNEDGTSELVIASATSPVQDREVKERERRYFPGSDLKSVFGLGQAGSKLRKQKTRDDGSVSGKSKSSSRRSDRERGRRKRRDDDYEDVHGA